MEGRRKEEITVSAKTLDDAITEALVQLGGCDPGLEKRRAGRGDGG